MSATDNFYDLGRIAWLWMQSSLHQKWSTRLMMRNVIPPVSSEQFKLISEGELPVAYASWAFFSAEAEKRYIINPQLIDINDWNSGDRMWFIDYKKL
jgi:cytolysin-activating lysine-acyltransferase